MRDLIETAKEWKVPPLTLLGVGAGEWTETDRTLALAHHAYRQGLCACCGNPRRLAHDSRMDGWYEPTETICEACAAKDRWNAEHKKKEPEPGLLLGVKDTRTVQDQMSGTIPR